MKENRIYMDLDEIDTGTVQMVFGREDRFLGKIERSFGVDIVYREGRLTFLGDEAGAEGARNTIQSLFSRASDHVQIDEQSVDYAITLEREKVHGDISQVDNDLICHTLAGKPIKPKTLGQKEYVDAIRRDMIVFGLGPAGTGKTYLAMALAITALKHDEVSRIILTRPAIEAGERLGFLPGDLQSKVDPYLRPLYDALYQIMGMEAYQKNVEKGAIEVAPLAYMRGRTLDNSFIILDEAQNTTPAQMKMFLTRVGFGSKVVITGDLTQKDLNPEVRSGLETAREVLKGIEGISFCELTSLDVVRHPLVAKIVRAYEKYEEKRSVRYMGRSGERQEKSGRGRDRYPDNNPGRKSDRYPEGKRR